MKRIVAVALRTPKRAKKIEKSTKDLLYGEFKFFFLSMILSHYVASIFKTNHPHARPVILFELVIHPPQKKEVM